VVRGSYRDRGGDLGVIGATSKMAVLFHEEVTFEPTIQLIIIPKRIQIFSYTGKYIKPKHT
jgi:hypothetical protein